MVNLTRKNLELFKVLKERFFSGIKRYQGGRSSEVVGRK